MIRKLESKDLSDVLLIENLSDIHPWTIEMFQAYVDSEEENHLGKQNLLSAWVAENLQGIQGFICHSSVSPEAEIHKIAVHPQYRRQGIGLYLLGHALEKLKENHVEKVFLEVREKNISAQKLYEKQDFIRVNVRKAYYSDGESAWIYQCKLNTLKQISLGIK